MISDEAEVLNSCDAFSPTDSSLSPSSNSWECSLWTFFSLSFSLRDRSGENSYSKLLRLLCIPNKENGKLEKLKSQCIKMLHTVDWEWSCFSLYNLSSSISSFLWISPLNSSSFIFISITKSLSFNILSVLSLSSLCLSSFFLIALNSSAKDESNDSSFVVVGVGAAV